MEEIQTPPDGTEQEPVTPPINPEPAAPEPAAPAPIDYEEKFKQSSREAQVLASQLEQERARNIPLTINPTEQELRDTYPDWETFLPAERQILRENLSLKKTIAQTNQTVAEVKAEQSWQKDLKNVVKTFPKLAGHEAEFETFVFKPTHRGVSIESLAKAFLYDATKDMTPLPSPSPQGELERGGTGPQSKPKPKLLTGEELKTLRETDTRAYKDYVLKHPKVLEID